MKSTDHAGTVQELSAVLAAALQVAGDEWKADASFKLAEQAEKISMLTAICNNAGKELDAMTDERDFWKKRANELSDRMAADVQPLLVGDPLVFAARAYQKPANGEAAHKINAIKELRNLTRLGLTEAKLAVEQIIKIMEMKEATE